MSFQLYQDFLRALFTFSDTISFAFIKEENGKKEIAHDFVQADRAFGHDYFNALQKVNETFNVYVGMNPFKSDLIGQNVGRKKENVREVKRLYAEVDANGEAVLNDVLTSKITPRPSVVLESSPGKYQFIWNVDGLTRETAGPLLKALALQFNTDPAVAEIARVMRVPGFKNRKYAEVPEVKIVGSIDGDVYHPVDFQLHLKPQEFEKKSEGWINERMIHGNINNQLTRIAGYYIQNKNIDDAEILCTILVKHAENQAVHKDGVTPFCCNHDEIRQIATGCVSRYKTGEEKRKLETLTLNQQPAVGTVPKAEAGFVDLSNWLDVFRSVEEMEDGPIVMVVDGVLQEGICFIGANPDDGKTLVGLAFAKAISTGTPLFDLREYSVSQARTVIYLIPESRDRAFRKRCEAFRMPADKMKFMARTISAGIPLELNDPYLLEAVRQTKAVVFLDTASRFMKGSDENAAAQNRQLVSDVITLLAAGAVCIVLIHHATKQSKAKRETMTLENMLRGSSDLGAMCDQAYGLRKDMGLYANGAGPMEIDLVNLKDREQIGGLSSIRLAASYNNGSAFPASCINEEGNFRVISDTEAHKRNTDTLVSIVKVDPNLPEKELAVRTGLSEYAVKRNLNELGWHRVKGGPTGASPWHQDSGMCPYAKPTKANKPKLAIAEAVAYLREQLAGNRPGGQYTGVAEADIFSGADTRGLSDALIGKAKKRLAVLVNKDTKEWSLPGGPEVEPILESQMIATNR